jgi:MarR family transcriptional regulator, lower aerobic nicotinate degradation pathway regulator
VKYKLLENILPLLEAFEATNPDEVSEIAFARWLVAQNAAPPVSALVEGRNEQFSSEDPMFLDNLVRLVNMYRYAKNYVRQLLPTDIPILFDDFGYLMMLFFEGKQSKMDLIARNIHEKSTGMEIINRLERLDIVQILPNETDRRSKWVILTVAGDTLVKRILMSLPQFSTIINGDLSESQTKNLHQILTQLDHFHRQKFAKKK